MKNLITLLLLTMIFGTSALANVTGLYNTGVDNFGSPLGNLIEDSHYTLIAPAGNTAYAINRHSAWVNPGSNAMWVGPTASNVTDPVGLFVYSLTFNIDSAPSNVTIEGQWATDNSGEIWLNGVNTGITRDGFNILQAFTLSSGFIAGDNVLEFRVYNAAGSSGNPTGLLVTDLTATVVPVPGAILLGGIGTALVGWMKRRNTL